MLEASHSRCNFLPGLEIEIFFMLVLQRIFKIPSNAHQKCYIHIERMHPRPSKSNATVVLVINYPILGLFLTVLIVPRNLLAPLVVVVVIFFFFFFCLPALFVLGLPGGLPRGCLALAGEAKELIQLHGRVCSDAEKIPQA